MLTPLIAATVASVGVVHYVGHGTDARPIATPAGYPAAMADDVRRPGFNGRLWVDRPILGAIQQGPYAIADGSPGPDAYGAFDRPDATVYARVGHLVVGVNAWDSIDQEGLKRLEHARNFWLKEQGYTGGVRTMVNDANLWMRQEPPAPEHASAGGVPLPRATITLPADLPRQHRRLRVDAAPAPVRLPGDGPARISWPDTAPGSAVARTEARGGLIGLESHEQTIVQALPR
jgi:hypothetical protein